MAHRPVNSDFTDFLVALLAAKARVLVVGAHALAVHGTPRATGDIGVWIDRTPVNVARVRRDRVVHDYEDLGDLEALGENPHVP